MRVARLAALILEKQSRLRKKMNNKMKFTLVAIVLANSTFAVAREDAPYANAKSAQFVVEKLEVTSLPSGYRPEKEKGKKTLADYGYGAQKLEEREAFLEQPAGARYLSIKILEESKAGIYACVAVAQADGSPILQNVMLLKRKNATALLKGRQSGKEFTSCPAIGEKNVDAGLSAD